MALQSSGQITLQDIQNEFGGSHPISLSEYYGAEGSLPTSGQIAMNQFYGLSDVTAPVWNSSTKTFDLGTPDIIHTKTGNFTLEYNGAVAIIAIGGGGGGGSHDDWSGSQDLKCTGGGGGGVAIKGLVGTTSMSFTASAGDRGGIADDYYSNPYWNGDGEDGGTTTVSGNGISLTANGGGKGHLQDKNASGVGHGGTASGGDANYTGGTGIAGAGEWYISGGGGAGGGNSSSTTTTGSAGGSSPLKTGWLSSYIGNGGRGRHSGYPDYGHGHGGNYGGGGGGGGSGDFGTTRGNGGRGGYGRILVCYWT